MCDVLEKTDTRHDPYGGGQTGVWTDRPTDGRMNHLRPINAHSLHFVE